MVITTFDRTRSHYHASVFFANRKILQGTFLYMRGMGNTTIVSSKGDKNNFFNILYLLNCI